MSGAASTLPPRPAVRALILRMRLLRGLVEKLSQNARGTLHTIAVGLPRNDTEVEPHH